MREDLFKLDGGNHKIPPFIGCNHASCIIFLFSHRDIPPERLCFLFIIDFYLVVFIHIQRKRQMLLGLTQLAHF
jgi:hypothetical protein